MPDVPQRARLKAVESLKQSKRRVVVIATDVAARGLDIPSVATVVHYDASRTVDTFVHRAGRTAVSQTMATFISDTSATVMNKRLFGLESLKVYMLIHTLGCLSCVYTACCALL
jgi:superfamily II DNA/RNA helicase